MWQRNYRVNLLILSGAIAFAAFLLFGSSPVYSQTTSPRPPPRDGRSSTDRPSKHDNDNDDLGSDIGSHEREMRAKLALRDEKKKYDENVARAKEAAEIATQLLESYQTRKAFNSEDNKKLERMEKLTRRIRNEAGGTETASELKEIPAVVESAVKLLAEAADDLRKEVEKTPRHVVSAAVIDQANKLISLTQFVRNQAR